jgi:clumping factor A
MKQHCTALIGSRARARASTIGSRAQTRASTLASLLALLVLCLALPARAEQKLRIQVNQRGDFVLIGNTLGWDCDAPASQPVLGTVAGACGLATGDSSPDLFWRADQPADGQATASVDVNGTQARSSAVLQLAQGAGVTHAFLYWAGRRAGTQADTGVLLERPGGFSQAVSASASYTQPVGLTGADVVYQSVADVTSLVRANGSGVFRVSGVDVTPFATASEDVLFAGWALVVLYQLESDPPRNLAVFDGLDGVSMGNDSAISLSGFLVPNAGFDAKLGAIVYEGDEVFNGDSLLFGTSPLDASDQVSDAQNPADNFFNGTRSLLGRAVSTPGDLPQLAGTASTMAGMDLDVIEVTSRLSPGQTRADLSATSSLDEYFLGAFVTSISTFRPDFVSSQKTVRDVNGGAVRAGEELEYTITLTNTGNDASARTVLTDALPAGVSLVPGSIRIVDGPNAGAKTEAAGDDQASFDAAMRTLTVRAGEGASATAGGSIAVGASQSFSFRVSVDVGTKGIISNQARIEAAGQRGAPAATTVTDGNADGPGAPPTDIPTGECTGDEQCSGSKPFCDTDHTPGTCVECTQDAQCPGQGARCDPTTRTCTCPGNAPSCLDTDHDGVSDGDEIRDGSDPSDADTDDDGAIDGKEPSRSDDSDGDGLVNVLDPDSDDDGLYDGTELGFGCDNPATKPTPKHCRPDGDLGATVTDPLDADSDDGGARDGSEDSDLDGLIDAGERDPTSGHGADDAGLPDTDGDGISNDTENGVRSNPDDADSDNDGLPDGAERNPTDDTDGDGRINLLDPDSDDDGLFDGTESGRDCSNGATMPGTTTMPGSCRADGDMGQTKTSPVDPDTDGGGAEDGDEDSDHDGVADPGERDPTSGHAADDGNASDADNDGLSDDAEDGFGSDKLDADSDDDGVRDGAEVNPGGDGDGDGKISLLDPDSDDDGLFDGTELGFGCDDPATDKREDRCVADGDMGQTKTSPVDPDTDDGSVDDGSEDSDGDGVVDPGERDPNRDCDDVSLSGCDEPPPVDQGRARSLAGSGGCGVRRAKDAQLPLWLGLSALVLLGRLRRRRF